MFLQRMINKFWSRLMDGKGVHLVCFSFEGYVLGELASKRKQILASVGFR